MSTSHATCTSAKWVDAHHHLWCIERTDYGWLTPQLGDLYRTFSVADYEHTIAQTPIGASVLIQAAPTVAETVYLLSLAEHAAPIQGVVGWVDFDDPKTAVQDITRLAKNPLFKGVRPMLQDITDTDYILNPKFAPVFEALLDHNLRFEALILPQGITAIGKIFEKYTDLACMVDHCAKPAIRNGIQSLAAWAECLRPLADMPHVYIKISGLLTEAQAGANTEVIKPYTDMILHMFGHNRIVWGSDWPVLNLASDYTTWVQMTTALLADLCQHDQQAITADNARHFYALPYT